MPSRRARRAVFASNAHGKTTAVAAWEFFILEDRTFERPLRLHSGHQAGCEALEHVNARKNGIAPAVGLALHSDEGGLDTQWDEHPVIAGATQHDLDAEALRFPGTRVRRELTSDSRKTAPEDIAGKGGDVGPVGAV